MRLSSDLREFLELLNSRGVEYVIVGGAAAAEAFATRIATQLDDIPVFVLSKEALIQNKRAVGRPQDLADLDRLEG